MGPTRGRAAVGLSGKAPRSPPPGCCPPSDWRASDWAARRRWSFSPPSGGVVTSGKSGSHLGVVRGLPRALGPSLTGLSARPTPTSTRFPLPFPAWCPFFLLIPSPFLDSESPPSWLFVAPPGEDILAPQACPRSPETEETRQIWRDDVACRCGGISRSLSFFICKMGEMGTGLSTA